MIWLKRDLKDHLIASPLTWDLSTREGCTKPHPSWQWMVFDSRHGELWWALSVWPACPVCQCPGRLWLLHRASLLKCCQPRPQAVHATGGLAVKMDFWLWGCDCQQQSPDPAAFHLPVRGSLNGRIAVTATAIPWETTHRTYGNGIKKRNGGSRVGAVQSTELDVLEFYWIPVCLGTESYGIVKTAFVCFSSGSWGEERVRAELLQQQL